MQLQSFRLLTMVSRTQQCATSIETYQDIVIRFLHDQVCIRSQNYQEALYS